jgi:hypothetical protein
MIYILLLIFSKLYGGYCKFNNSIECDSPSDCPGKRTCLVEYDPRITPVIVSGVVAFLAFFIIMLCCVNCYHGRKCCFAKNDKCQFSEIIVVENFEVMNGVFGLNQDVYLSLVKFLNSSILRKV